MATDSIPAAKRCSRCGEQSDFFVDGRCGNCISFNRCIQCGEGNLVSKPTPNWQNRYVCDRCGRKVSL